MRKILLGAAIGAACLSSAQAASFLNGGFETGDLNSWGQASGSWYGSPVLPLDPSNYTTGPGVNTVVGPGPDARTDNNLNTVRYGNFSARVNDSVQNYEVSVLRQTVANYDGTSINFSWAAVLEESHDATDSSHFALKVTDQTTSNVLYSSSYSSATTDTLFTRSTSGWYYTAWQDVSLTVAQGHTYLLELLASDCPYGGHAGYVYLDGFGTVAGGGGDNGAGGDPGVGAVPVPGSLALLALGALGLGTVRRTRRA